jgi:hypothetical protein
MRITSMVSRICLPAHACAVLSFSLAASAGEKQATNDLPEIRVRLRLNASETSALLEHYEAVLKRQLALQGSVRAYVNPAAGLRVHQQDLQEVQEDLE